MTALDARIAALERTVQEQAQQIAALLAAASPAPVEASDEIDAAMAYRIRQMAKADRLFYDSQPPRRYTKRVKAA